jgi:hypothetical protein
VTIELYGRDRVVPVTGNRYGRSSRLGFIRQHFDPAHPSALLNHRPDDWLFGGSGGPTDVCSSVIPGSGSGAGTRSPSSG